MPARPCTVARSAAPARRDSFAAPGNLPAWLHQVVRTTVADHYRAGRLHFESLEEEPADEEPEDVAAFQALATCMEPLTATLPSLYRHALLGADFQGQRLAVLADAAGGVTVSAINGTTLTYLCHF